MPIIDISPIGTIHTPHKDLKGMPIQPTGAKDIIGQVEIFLDYQEGLADLDGFSHIFLIYNFHQSKGFNLTVTPFMDKTPRGLFSTRAPKRPNPIGLSVVELLSVSANMLTVRGVDILDKTPLLDIKPFVPNFDAPEVQRTGWLQTRADRSQTQRSDTRFCDQEKNRKNKD